MPQNDWTIYYNPKCGTCRKALDLLKSKGVEPHIIEYLKTPPSFAELQSLADKVEGGARAMLREKEDVFEKLNLGDGKKTEKDFLKAMAEHPILIQRPIVVRGNKAVIARPPELAKELL